MKTFFSLSPPLDQAMGLHRDDEAGALLCLVELSKIDMEPKNGDTEFRSLLSSEEQRHLQRFRFVKRRREWLGGRIAAKACLLARYESEKQAAAWSVLPDRHGRPVLSGPDCGEILSISHSGDYAVAMLCRTGCGVDIQQITPQILKVRDRFATPEEQALANRASPRGERTGLTMVWAVKESLKKHRLSGESGIFEAIMVLGISGPDAVGVRTATCSLRGESGTRHVRLTHLGNSILAWSMDHA